MPGKSKYRIALDNLPKNKYYGRSYIKNYILENVDIDELEKRPSNKKSEKTIWEHKLDGALRGMKTQNLMQSISEVSAKKSSDGKYHEPEYMFLEKEFKERKQARHLKDPQKYFRAINQLEKNHWYTGEEIYDHIEKTVDFEDWELEVREGRDQLVWKNKVSIEIYNLCNEGYAEREEHIRAIDSPTGVYKPTRYKFKDFTDYIEELAKKEEETT